MTTLMDEPKGEAAWKAAKARGDTRGQHKAWARALRDTNSALISLLPRHKRAKARKALLR